ncbi:hypothetical protein, partial [Marinobacter mangrovi]|uniref:hypothetical protein n=1 Tax=Marinobacter mangrovi TaxID=2803918 RepID=UPI001931E6AB
MKRLLIVIAALYASCCNADRLYWDASDQCAEPGETTVLDIMKDKYHECLAGGRSCTTTIVNRGPANCGGGASIKTYQVWVVEDPATPEECDELGLAYDGHAYACIDLEECPNGAFGDGTGSYTCLTDVTEPDEPNESRDPNTGNNCTTDSDDYKGVFNGKYYCNSNLPEAPTCKEGTSHIVDNGNGSYGFACAAMPESPDDAQDEDTETTSVIEDDDQKIERTVNSKTGAVTTKTTDKNTGEVTVTTTYPGIDSQTGEPCTEDSLYCYKSDQ